MHFPGGRDGLARSVQNEDRVGEGMGAENLNVLIFRGEAKNERIEEACLSYRNGPLTSPRTAADPAARILRLQS